MILYLYILYTIAFEFNSISRALNGVHYQIASPSSGGPVSVT